MNIFFIDKCPILAAQQLCDKHVVNMVVETAQMCSTAVHYWQEGWKPKDLLHCIYKPAYRNHPMTKWVRNRSSNTSWAVRNGIAIGDEYKYRYGKDHKSTAILKKIKGHMKKLECWSSSDAHTVPPQCMPDQYKKDDHDYVEAYRDFYRNDKAYFYKWTKREKPEWISFES